MTGGNRGADDGFTYFGTLKHSMPDARGQFSILNDYVLPPFQMPKQSVAQSPITHQQHIDSSNTYRMGSIHQGSSSGGCQREMG